MRFFSQKNRPTRKRVGVCMWERGLLDGCGSMRVAVARAMMCRWGEPHADLPQGYACCDGAALAMDQVDLMDQMDKIGAPLNNPWVCVAAVWIGSGADLPQGLRCRSVEWLGRRLTVG